VIERSEAIDGTKRGEDVVIKNRTEGREVTENRDADGIEEITTKISQCTLLTPHFDNLNSLLYYVHGQLQALDIENMF
jgi:hypothetical protein